LIPNEGFGTDAVAAGLGRGSQSERREGETYGTQ
jgi:hypothetical protein